MGGLTRRATTSWRELPEVMRPFTTGSDYVNKIGLETDEGSEPYGARRWQIG
jgi:hypothetical protein